MSTSEKQIDLSKLSEDLKVPSNYFQPTLGSVVESEARANHTVEPIKSCETIDKICKFLLENGRYRDYMLFIVGINTGLRVSDLVRLRFCDLIGYDVVLDELYFKKTFPVFEIKTRNTRKKPKNRYLGINENVRNAVKIYLHHCAESGNMPNLDDFMFVSQSSKDLYTVPKNRSKDYEPHLNRKSVERILKGIKKDLQLSEKVGTHTLRKTFAYHQLLIGKNDQRRLILLQKILGHSSLSETLDYVGITREEIEQAYLDSNVGYVPSLTEIYCDESPDQQADRLFDPDNTQTKYAGLAA